MSSQPQRTPRRTSARTDGNNQDIFGGKNQDIFGGENQDIFGGKNQNIFGGKNQDIFGRDVMSERCFCSTWKRSVMRTAFIPPRVE